MMSAQNRRLRAAMDAVGSWLDCWDGEAPTAVTSTSDGAELTWSVPSLSGGEIIRLAIRDGMSAWCRDTDRGPVSLTEHQARDFLVLPTLAGRDAPATNNEASRGGGVRCPKCDAAMVRRTNHQRGNEFLGCAAYPSCSGTRTIDPPPAPLADQVGDINAVRARTVRWRGYFEEPYRAYDEDCYGHADPTVPHPDEFGNQ